MVNFNEVMEFMKSFGVDCLNRFGELIIDVPNNIYAYIGDCEDIEDVQTRVVWQLCRPIYKGLNDTSSKWWLERINNYFSVNLSWDDIGILYQQLCYRSKLGEFKDFIKRGFPMEELLYV